MAKRIWRYVSRFVGMLLVHVAVSQILFYVPQIDPASNNYYADPTLAATFSAMVCLVAAAVLYYDMQKQAAWYDDAARAALYANGVRQHTLREKLRFWIGQKHLWVETAVLAGVYLAVPLDLTWGVLSDFVLGGRTEWWWRPALLPSLLAAVVLLGLAARVKAVDRWFAHEVGEHKLYRPHPKGKDRSSDAFFKGIIGSALGVTVVAFAAGFVFPVLAGYLPVFLVLLRTEVVIAVIVIVVLGYLLRLLRRAWRRRRFLKRLRAVCEATGYTIEKTQLPYRSLLALYDGENIRLRSEKRVYSIKFLTTKGRRKPLLLREDGICEFLTVVRIGPSEMTRLSRAYSFAWESDGYRVLLPDPVPYKVLNARGEELDNGSAVGDYKLFTPNAFLNALERDCVER